MSLALTVKSPEGIVIATDSRATFNWTPTPELSVPVHYDTATKLIRFDRPNAHVAIATYGRAVIPGPNRTPASFVPEFSPQISRGRLGTKELASQFAQFLMEHWDTQFVGPLNEMYFLIAGFDEGEAYGRLWGLSLPTNNEPEEYWPDTFGVRWGGQSETLSRLFNGYSESLFRNVVSHLALHTDTEIASLREIFSRETTNIPWPFLSLHDCVNLASFAMDATVGLQDLAMTIRGVGGPIDMLAITREGIQVIRWKQLGGG